MDPVDVHVISHTHWDREWYATREQFRVRLVDLIDRAFALDLLERRVRELAVEDGRVRLSLARCRIETVELVPRSR